MTKQEINEELNRVLGLLLTEKQEDLKQYKHRLQSSSFSDRRKNGICWYPVGIEKSSYSNTELLIVKISRNPQHNDAHSFQSGRPVSLFSNASGNTENSETVEGVVNSVEDHDMYITLNTRREPEWLYDGKLGVQLLFNESSYREMERGMVHLIGRADERLDELKLILLGKEDAKCSSITPVNIPSLNESQNRALNKVLAARDLAIIHGPPGTGKTTTLVEAIVQTLKKEKQILVCAPSNAAADLLAEKLGQRKIKVLRLGHPARVNEDILSKTLDARISVHKQFKQLKSLRQSAEEYHILGKKYKRNFGPEERAQRKLLLNEAKKFKLEANQLSDYIKEDILNKSKVVVTTLVGANNINLKNRIFSTVFIDEAAQGLEPATWLPIIKSKRVVFAGDHCQLPPTIRSNEAAKEGLETTLFEKAILNNEADVMLTEQYRMHEKIMRFSSRYFYRNELTANIRVKDWLIFPEDAPVDFIDTAGCGFYEAQGPDSKSYLNPEEMELLFRHLGEYLDKVEGLNLIDLIEDIGIISPYKAQVIQMQKSFKGSVAYREEFTPKITVNTIDSFQGQERDIVYISLVRSNDKGEIGFLKDIRRMNVAITRARKKLVIIGDSATIGRHPFYSELLDYINEIDAYKSAFEYLYD